MVPPGLGCKLEEPGRHEQSSTPLTTCTNTSRISKARSEITKKMDGGVSMVLKQDPQLQLQLLQMQRRP